MSRSLNKVMLIGNVGSEPDIRATSSGTQVAKVSLATNRQWKDGSGQQKEKTEWHRLTFFGRLVDIVDQWVKKGGPALRPKGASNTPSRKLMAKRNTGPISSSPRWSCSGRPRVEVEVTAGLRLPE